MRVPQEVQWDREVVYECMWSLLCAVDKHNRSVKDMGGADGSRIQRLMMSPLATGVGGVSAERWAAQVVLATKHFVMAVEDPMKWSALGWGDLQTQLEVQKTWSL